MSGLLVRVLALLCAGGVGMGARDGAPRRWSLVAPGDPAVVAWSGFDPRAHTPNFSNDQAVYETKNGRTRPAYRGGLCWGICELAHLYFRELTRREPDPALARPFLACMFPDGRVPPPGDAARSLRALCAAPRERARVAAIAAALQLDAPPDGHVPARDAEQLVRQIETAIRADGTAIVHIRRVDPTRDCRMVNSHNVLAYAMFEAEMESGSVRRRALAIRIWDPVFAFAGGGAAGPAAVMRDRGQPGAPRAALLYDRATRTLTFDADYLERKRFRAPDARAGRAVLQPGECLEVGRDIMLRRPSAALAAQMFSCASGTDKVAAIALDRWPRMPAQPAVAE